LSPLVRHSLISKLKGPGLLSTSPDKHISIAAREVFKKSLVPISSKVEFARGFRLKVDLREFPLNCGL
jgi:hypothetical protein